MGGVWEERVGRKMRWRAEMGVERWVEWRTMFIVVGLIG